MFRGWLCRLRGLVWLVAAAGLGWAQTTPTITPPLQSSPPGTSGPTLGNAITSATPLTSFLLYINGAFNPNNAISVTWLNTTTGATATFGIGNGIQSVGATQIVVNVPAALFSGAVTSQQTANVTVTETAIGNSFPTPVVSNAAPFLLNPPMAATASPLPTGTVGVAYSQPIYTGGTAPFANAIATGNGPPGLTLPRTGGALSGTPTTAGTYTFTSRLGDAWSNALTVTDSVTIDAPPPTIAPPLVPASTPAGTNGLQITINGTNFQMPVVGIAVFPGSTVQWFVPGSNAVSLATTVNSATQLVATVPASLLTAPVTAAITVVQPSGQTSNSVSFPVLAPSITSLAPATVAAGSPGFTLTVTGANFLSGSQIVFGTQPLTTTFVSGTSLTAPVSAAMIATAGPVTVTVTNPGGSRSGTATFTVAPALTITTASLANGEAGVAYSAPLAASGGTAPYTFGIVGTGPPGLAISGGALSGTPTTAGTYSFSISATDAAQGTASKAFAVTIAPAVTITTASLPNGQVGVAYSAQLAASGGATPYGWTIGGLPPGLTATSGGALSGTPTSNGAFTIAATVSDALQGSARQSYAVAIAAPVPTIASLSPAGVVVGAAAFTLTVSGANFVSGAQIVFGGTALNTTFVSSTSLTAPVSTAQVAAAGSSAVTVVNPGGIASAPASFAVFSKLSIVTTSLPSAQANGSYDTFLAATGGVPPYTWSASGLPGTVTLNPATGEIKGTWPSTGSFSVSVSVNDASGQRASTQYGVTVSTPPIPLQIVTPSPLAPATVGQPYSAIFAANGGTSPYTFTLQGTAPPGLPFSQGVLNGTPTTPGTYSFTIAVTDAANNSASKAFVLVVQPAALTVTGSVSDATVGASISDTFGASGGVPPYAFSASGSLPTGAKFSGSAQSGTLAGTLTAAGTFTFAVTAMDSAGSTASKSFTIHVTVPAVTITTASLPNGQVGVSYSAQLGATGGVPPYAWSVGGLPAGLSASGAGAINGTPTAAGVFSVTATVNDTAGGKASQSYAVTIAAAGLTVTTTSLGNGVVGSAYSAALGAAGGTPPYSWTVTGLPAGLSASGAGAISGTPTATGVSTVGATVTDSQGAMASASFKVTISAAPLTITTATIAGGTAGTAVSVNLGAAGGVPPYTWTIGGLPQGVSASSGGAITGTPTAVGSFTVTATVTDSAGSTASTSLSWTIGLPAAPPLTLSGLPASANPGTQSTLQVSLGNAYPVDVAVGLTLTFTPTTGGDDPAVQFSTGGRSATITVPAGQTAGATSVGVQTGTVAGTVTITAQLTAAGQNVTPTPAPSRTIQIPATAPVITSVTAASNSTGFTVTVVGYSSTRDVASAVFTFTPASGANLTTGQVTVPVGPVFSAWYQSAASAPYGSQFTLTQPFTVNGNLQAVASVSVTLTNSVGTSAASSAAVH